MAFLCKLAVLLVCFTGEKAFGLQFENELVFDENCTLLWNVGTDNEVVFEVQARTFGYVGVGFSQKGELSGSDVVVVWMNNGNGFIEDLHIGSSGTVLKNDTKQDYHLALGYENSTHTVIRFHRKMQTCNGNEDFPITSSTLHIHFFLSNDDPDVNSTAPFKDFLETHKGTVATSLLGSPSSIQINANDIFMSTKELRNDKVVLPANGESLSWCKMFRILDFVDKNHLVKFEPVFDGEIGEQFLEHIIVYECHDNTPKHDRLARLRGKKCHRPDFSNLQCNSIAAYWSRGSKGFTFPKDTGYPLYSKDIQFYLMETHYHNSQYKPDDMDVPTPTTTTTTTKPTAVTLDMYQNQNETANEKAAADKPQMVDSSGLKIYFTLDLRQHDAGALSIGIDPNWRHMIPPGQPSVVSEGHCIGACTEPTFPQDGINIFAVMTNTQTIGRQIRLRQIRDNNETQPIIVDSNIVPNYQEFRYLPTPVKALPGDQLIAECTYDSSTRKYITLGGHTMKDETCGVFLYYYPRQDRLSSCTSQPSLSTVLRALGIEKLTYGPTPLVIAAPAELANMTIEDRLATFDWETGFSTFQEAMQQGEFKPYCWSSKFKAVQGTERLQITPPVIDNIWQPLGDSACEMGQDEISASSSNGNDGPSDADNEISNVIDVMSKSVQGTRTHSAPTEIKTATSTVVAVKPSHASRTMISVEYFAIVLVIVFRNS